MRYSAQVFYIVELIILIFKYNDLPSYKIDNLLISLIIAVLNVVVFFSTLKKSRAISKFSIITVLFVMGYFIVFFQRYFDLLLGFRDSFDYCFANERTIMKCVIISLSGQCAFFLGNLLYTFKKTCNPKPSTYTNLGSLKLIFICITLLFLYFNFYKLFSYSYSQDSLEAEAGTMVLYSSMFYQIVLALILSYTVCNLKQLQLNNFNQFYNYLGVPFHFCLALYILFHLILGDRGPLIVCVSMYFGAYMISVKRRISFLKIAPLVACAIFLLFFVGETRNMGGGLGLSQKMDAAMEKSSMATSIFPFTDELAGSVMTLHYSVDNVPESHPHVYGLFTLRTIASWIPFSDRVISSFISLDSRYRSSAFFITWLIQGDNYTYGNGSSCNADLYLNFGLWGVISGLLLWGLFLRYLESSAPIRSSINFWIIFMFTIGYAIYVNRSDLLVFSNYVIFTIFFNYLWRLFCVRR